MVIDQAWGSDRSELEPRPCDYYSVHWTGSYPPFASVPSSGKEDTSRLLSIALLEDAECVSPQATDQPLVLLVQVSCAQCFKVQYPKHLSLE